MDLDVKIEIGKLNKIINGKQIPLFQNYIVENLGSLRTNTKIKYLLYVLRLTYNHPEIEIYLEGLLENYSIAELNNLNSANYNILHSMIDNLVDISLNSFEIIINFGINVNRQNNYKNTPLHHVAYCLFNATPENIKNVINLFAKYGADLNILNLSELTVLDVFINYYREHRGQEIIIITLIDCGAKTNHTITNRETMEFIESYLSSSIKPAIKNEIKI